MLCTLIPPITTMTCNSIFKCFPELNPDKNYNIKKHTGYRKHIGTRFLLHGRGQWYKMCFWLWRQLRLLAAFYRSWCSTPLHTQWHGETSRVHIGYAHHKKIKMSHSPIKYQFEMKVFFLFERNLPLFRWTDLKSLQQVLIFRQSRCICSIKREQLVARCHGKTLFPICYSHTE